MTVVEFQAEKIEGAASLLSHWFLSTAEDRRGWIPAVDGAANVRCARDMVSECIHVNRLLAAILRGETPAPIRPIEAPRPFATDDDAMAQLTESARECAESVRALGDSRLLETFTTHRGTMPAKMVIEIPYRNMLYHGGQINLLQLLYGDTSFSFPAPPK